MSFQSIFPHKKKKETHRVQGPKEDDRRCCERECNLLKDGCQASVCGRGHVLVADEVVDEGTAESECDHFSDGDCPECCGGVELAWRGEKKGRKRAMYPLGNLWGSSFLQ
jgi:hypothetical protein